MRATTALPSRCDCGASDWATSFHGGDPGATCVSCGRTWVVRRTWALVEDSVPEPGDGDGRLCEDCVEGVEGCERLARPAPSPFVSSWNAVETFAHATAVEKGWWDSDRNDGELLALMHSELSELLEALRHGNGPSEHVPAFSGAEEEAADLVIRLMDMAAARGWRVAAAVEAKMAFNGTRPVRHGKLF